VIAPRNFKEVFMVLGSISPGLVKLLETPLFEKDYWMYRAMRLSVMLRLSNIIRGEGKGQAQDQKSSNGPHLDEEARKELDRIVEFFAQDVTTKYALASVVRTAPVEAADKRAPDKNLVSLKKGIATGKPQNLPGEYLGFQKVMKRMAVLRDVFNGLTLIYSEIRRREVQALLRSAGLENESKIRINMIDYIYEKCGFEGRLDQLRWAAERCRKAGIDAGEFFDHLSNPALARACREYADDVYRTIADGTIDAECGLESGTMMGILQSFIAYSSIEPKERLYDVWLSHMLREAKTTAGQEQKRKALEKEIERVVDSLKKKGHFGEWQTSHKVFSEMQGHDVERLTLEGVITKEELHSMKSGCYDMDGAQLDGLIRKIVTKNGTYGQLHNGNDKWWIASGEKHELLEGLGIVEAVEKIEKRCAEVARSIVSRQTMRRIAGY